MKTIIKSCPVWNELFNQQITRTSISELQTYVANRRKEVKVYPAPDDVLRAFKLTSYYDVDIVIIGQDPYHDGSAHGLSFSCNSNKRPASLRVIVDEIMETEYPDFNKKEVFPSNNLSGWARQGVLLLNRVLTVEKGTPNAHKNKGWEEFTDAVVTTLNDRKDGIIYMLWGKAAQSLEPLIASHHHILKASHPSPLNKHGQFSGCDHFRKANKIIKEHYKNKKAPISWCTLKN